jgi:hypothetical protein
MKKAGKQLVHRPPFPNFARAMAESNITETSAHLPIANEPYTIRLQRFGDSPARVAVIRSQRVGGASETAAETPPRVKTAKPRKKTISAADVLDDMPPPAAPAPLDVLDAPAPLDELAALDALDVLDEPGALDAPAVARLDREAEREAVAEFAPLARRRGRHERRTYTAQDVADDIPPPRPQPDRDTIQAALVRKVLRGVGAWAQSHPDDDTARELGGILIALAAESQLAERGARAGVTVGDQAFAHLYWAAHPPTEPDKWNAGLVAAAQAAILLAKGETQAAIDMLSPTRRPNPIPVWAETLLQLARLITALSAASSAGIAINQTALAGDATLATLDTAPSDAGNTDTGGR